MSEQITTVEELVRHKLSEAFGGVRGVIESALPIVAFTIAWISTANLRLSLTVAIALAVAMLVVRLAQRSTIQFVLNAAIGIAIAAVFASRSGEARDVFLPGILYNAGYAVLLVLSILVRWPVVGFMFGAVVGDPTGWRNDRALVTLCSRLTWCLVLPCILRVAVQYPLWAADQVALLGTAKIVLGWPLQIASFAAMAWLLSRNSTPIAAAD